jgi:predicted ATPase/transcriptional regulator with XRE-family HTH domain
MVTQDAVSFGALLRRQRLAAGLTQEALAERAGLSAKAVSDLERDPARTPRLGTVTLLADALAAEPERRAELLAAARPASGQGQAAPDAAGPAAELSRRVMPRPLTPLIGRAGVTAAVVKLLRRGDIQLLTLTGPGGVGKTRLAIAVAEQVAGDFADGTVFVDLAPLRDPGLVLSAIARQLGVDERDATPLAGLLAAALRARQLLVLLDNFEHLLAARDSVLALLETCPRLVMLVTSRVALDVRGGREYPIAPLVLPDATVPPETLGGSPAVQLFVERAKATGADLTLDAGTAAAVAEICRRLEGLPLAIELAAARTRLLPPAALLDRLDRRLPVLAGGLHDLPARQQTMRDAIAWSYDLLDEPQQALFRRMCVFTGGCTLDAAEVICADDGDAAAVVDGLTALMASSLLRMDETAAPAQAALPGQAAVLGRAAVRGQTAAPGQRDVRPAAGAPRVTMLETIREYGTERLGEHSEAAPIGQRHAACYLALAEDAAAALAGPAAAGWLVRLDTEHDNLRAALRWTLDRGDRVTALRLAGALWRFWAQRGHLSEGRRWFTEAFALPGDASLAAPAAQVNWLTGAARLAMDQAAFDEASAYCEQAAALAREHGDAADQAAALNTHGLVARALNRYADSAQAHDAALPLARAAADRGGTAAALLGLAYAAMFTGDAMRAAARAEESLAEARESGDQLILAQVLFFLGWVASNGAGFERAGVLATEALSLFTTLGDTGGRAEALFVLGTVELYSARYQEAAGFFTDSLKQHRDHGPEPITARDLGGLGTALLNLGDLPRARAVLDESLVVARRYNNPWSSAMSLMLLGHVDLAEGDDNDAHAVLAEAASLFQATGNMVYLPWCLEGLAGLAAARGDYERAAELDGARDALRNQIGVFIPPVHPAGYSQTLEAARAGLTQAAFDAARARPADQTPQQIITATMSS